MWIRRYFIFDYKIWEESFKKYLKFIEGEDVIKHVYEQCKVSLVKKEHIFEDTEEFIKKEDYLNRYIFIPVAISNTEGIKTLYNNKHEGSSSLEKTWGGIDINNKTDVMAFKLRKFIEMIPERFTYIEHLKIDCEGHDLNVLKSCEDLIGRIAVITIEEKNARGYLLDTGIFEFLEEQKGGYTFINKKYKNLLGKLDYYIRV